VDKVQRLQRRLYVAAKRSPERRFHALFDRILRPDVLEEAWRRVLANRGAAGVDRETLADVEAYGAERMLRDLSDALRQGRYHPAPVRRRGIPKPDGGIRPLGIPTVRDRVAQQAAKLVLEPIFEADFLPVSFGYRPKRSATVRTWLTAGVMEDGVLSQTVSGTPQGGVISPLLANIYLHRLDAAFARTGQGTFVRYADDAVILCRTREEAEATLDLVRQVLTGLGLELQPDKTRIVDLGEGRQGFDFLGCHFHARVSGRLLERGIRRYYLHRWPSDRSMKRVRAKVKALTGRNRNGAKDVRVLIRDLNPVLRGWGTYFRTGNAAAKFLQIDRYVVGRLRRFLVKRQGRNLRPGQTVRWTEDWLNGLGLYRLRGTIRYPEAA
jgi:RNA-directed DNA polymerase